MARMMSAMDALPGGSPAVTGSPTSSDKTAASTNGVGVAELPSTERAVSLG